MKSDVRNQDQPQWTLDPELVVSQCVEFIRETVTNAKTEKLVLGLSGGIDSAVAAALAVRALGPDKVLGVMLPYSSSSEASLTDALAVAENLGIRTEKVEISAMADALLVNIDDNANVRRGNVMARCRMTVLYDRSARDGALVLGTGNRTEALLGYTTVFGDSACAFNPIGQLYKTEIRQLARYMELPESVITKAPSADLWEGQSDEDELGFSYAEVDNLFYHMYDQGLGHKQLEALGYNTDLIKTVDQRVMAMAFKRHSAPVAKFVGRSEPACLQPEDVSPSGSNDHLNDSFPDGGFH